jgi:hypothetical protein
MDGFFGQMDGLEEVASVGDGLQICPQLDSRVEKDLPPVLACGVREGLFRDDKLTLLPKVNRAIS